MEDKNNGEERDPPRRPSSFVHLELTCSLWVSSCVCWAISRLHVMSQCWKQCGPCESCYTVLLGGQWHRTGSWCVFSTGAGILFPQYFQFPICWLGGTSIVIVGLDGGWEEGNAKEGAGGLPSTGSGRSCCQGQTSMISVFLPHHMALPMSLCPES